MAEKQLADWTVEYTVRAGCQRVTQIAKDVGVAVDDLIAFNGDLGMLATSKLKAGTGLWVSATAMAAKAAAVAGA